MPPTCLSAEAPAKAGRSLGMAGEWEETVLANVSSDVSYGYTESATDEKVGPRFLRITDIQNGVVNWANVPFCPITADNHQKYRLQAGDIVVARTGNSTGENFLYRGDEDAVFASYLIRFRIDRHKADPGFVWYNLRSRDWWNFINNSKTGSAQAGANAKILGLFPLNLPPLPEQRAIAHILGTLDDKIELNRRMSETLEAMARALFKSWFVDYDPVRAKAESRDPGLPKPLADLFPDAFEDSELGEIPKGWRVRFIRDLTSNIQYGFTQRASSDLVGPRFLRITDIQGGKVDWATVPFCEVTPEEHERYLLKSGDVLVARTGASTGENIYLSYAPDAVFASYLVRFQFPDLANARLVGAFMRTQAYFEYVAGGIGGSAQPNASAQVLAGAQLVVPTPSIARMFSDLVVPLDLSIVANAHESRTLTALRDTLLPKLISGELRIEDAKRVIHDPPGQAAEE
jgi:type I restriction enzyme, S subunit